MGKRGFTLIELLVVIAILGVLSSIILSSLNNARSKAKEAKAELELKNLYTGIAMLLLDTGKWPGGCPPEAFNDPEINLDDQWAGINQLPPLGSPPINPGSCAWTATDRSAWNGPYAQVTLDPWGRSYLFDPDFCDMNGYDRPALVSLGSNGIEEYKSPTLCAGAPASSDDVVIYLPGTMQQNPGN